MLRHVFWMTVSGDISQERQRGESVKQLPHHDSHQEAKNRTRKETGFKLSCSDEAGRPAFPTTRLAYTPK